MTIYAPMVGQEFFGSYAGIHEMDTQSYREMIDVNDANMEAIMVDIFTSLQNHNIWKGFLWQHNPQKNFFRIWALPLGKSLGVTKEYKFRIKTISPFVPTVWKVNPYALGVNIELELIN